MFKMSSENSNSDPSKVSLVEQFDDLNSSNGVLNDGFSEEMSKAKCFQSKMSSENSNSDPSKVSLVELFDDLNSLNSVLNDGFSEECFLSFVKRMECEQSKLAAAEAEISRLQSELNEALRTLTKLEAKFAQVRKLLDEEKRERNIVLKKNSELSHLLKTVRDLFNDNRSNLSDETLQKLEFLNGNSAQELHERIGPEPNTTGTLLSEMSFFRLEDDLDLTIASTRRTWVQRGGWNAREPAAANRRRSSTSSATKQPISESSDEAPPRQNSLGEDCPPSTSTAPPHSSDSEGLARPASALAYGASPRIRPRQHTLVVKNFYRKETCTPCGKTLKFAKMGVRCEMCRARAHLECRALLATPCEPPGPAVQRGLHLVVGTIADFAPSTSPMVPAFMVYCISEVENRGLTERGLYRISPAEEDVERLKERLLRGCDSLQLSTEDIHVLCGCIIDFLRSLREPLLTNDLWPDFMATANFTEDRDATAPILLAVNQLPQPNRDTLAFLVLHLINVSKSPECEMGIDDLAEIFAPIIVGFGMITGAAKMYYDSPKIFRVMQLLLRLQSDYWVSYALPSDDESFESPERPKSRYSGFFFTPVEDSS